MKCTECRFNEKVEGDYHIGHCTIELPTFMRSQFVNIDRRRVYDGHGCDWGKPSVSEGQEL